MTAEGDGASKGPEGALRESEAQFHSLFEASDRGIMVIERLPPRPDGLRDWRYVAMNAKAGLMFGKPDLTGQSVREHFPDEDEAWYDLYDQALETGEAGRFERETAQGLVLQIHLARIGPPQARRVVVTMQDVTARNRIEQALLESEARFRAFVVANTDAIYLMSADWSEMRQLSGRGFLADTVETRSDWMDRYILPEDHSRVRAAVDQAIRTRSLFELEHAVRRADGSRGWTYSRAAAVLDDRGEIVEWLGAASDITERKAADERLRESEERRAFLLKLSDALRPLADPVAVQGAAAMLVGDWLGATRAYYVEYDPGSGVATVARDYAVAGAPSLVGRYEYEAYRSVVDRVGSGTTWVMEDVAADRELSQTERETLAALGVVSWIDVPLVKHGSLVAILCVVQDAPRQWTVAEKNLAETVAERTWAAVERARAEAAVREKEAHASLLLAELQNRVRNVLGLVRSIASRTLQTAETVEEAAEHMEGRLTALARTQAMLTRAVGVGVDLELLVRDELAAQAADEARIRVEGPTLLLAPRAAEVLTLAVHELATNASKYGAFSSPEGRLHVRWTVTPSGQGPSWLSLRWEESGVSLLASAPRRHGFGEELLTRRVPYDLKGRSDFELRPGGISCLIEFPLIPGESVLQTAAPDLERP